MSLKVQRTERDVTVRRCTRKQEVLIEETGDVRLVRVRTRDGLVRDEERPVTRQVTVPAEYVDETVKKTVFIVHDGTDEHEFADEAAAKQFAQEAGR